MAMADWVAIVTRCSWENVLYAVHVCAEIGAGCRSARTEQLYSNNAIRRLVGLKPMPKDAS